MQPQNKEGNKQTVQLKSQLSLGAKGRETREKPKGKQVGPSEERKGNQ